MKRPWPTSRLLQGINRPPRCLEQCGFQQDWSIYNTKLSNHLDGNGLLTIYPTPSVYLKNYKSSLCTRSPATYTITPHKTLQEWIFCSFWKVIVRHSLWWLVTICGRMRSYTRISAEAWSHTLMVETSSVPCCRDRCERTWHQPYKRTGTLLDIRIYNKAKRLLDKDLACRALRHTTKYIVYRKSLGPTHTSSARAY